ENGGVNLRVGPLVDSILNGVPGAGLVPQSVKDALVRSIEDGIRSATDNLLENAELIINRYSQSRPEFYGDVIVLRNNNAFYQNLKDTLVRLSGEGKVIDLFVLTHGGPGSI